MAGWFDEDVFDKHNLGGDMNTINTDFVRRNWQCKPEFTTADTSSLSNTITTCVSVPAYLDDEIKRKLNQIYRRREIEMTGVSFNDLEKDLKELGIELSTIRHSSGECGCEIEGYFRPEVYKTRNAREKFTAPTALKIKKDGKWFDLTPKKVIFSGPATTILWKDRTKTTVKCSSEDVWSDEVGIAMCYLKKMLGNKGNFNNIFREAMKVAEVQTKKEELASSTVIEGESYYSSALDSMKRNIDEINDFMKDAADVLDKALGGKK